MAEALSAEERPLFAWRTINLRFFGIKFTVIGWKGKHVEILKGISGACLAGRFLALMGASGAGKTSLLDVLAGKVQNGISGKVLANGRTTSSAQRKKLSCYVQQHDVLLATATVWESLVTSAFLKLPQEMSKAEKLRRVAATMTDLDLTSCANLLVGDDANNVKGISGGERRRLSVGISLVCDPSVIFLDEPTSGLTPKLDTENALQLCQKLRWLSRQTKTVVATIHQPNSNMTDMFDDLLLLAFGQVIYNGPWENSVDHFAAAGFHCPYYKNPADFYLTVTKDAERCNELLSHYTQILNAVQGHEMELKDIVIASGPCAPVKQGGILQLEPGANSNSNALLGITSPTTWYYQSWVLGHRFCRSWLRDPDLLLSFVGQYCFAGIFIGLLYWQLHRSHTGIFDRQASLFLIVGVLAFTPAETACTVWEYERAVFRRESLGGMYSAEAFFMAKSLVTIPFQARPSNAVVAAAGLGTAASNYGTSGFVCQQVLVTTFFCLIVYFMIGYQVKIEKFFAFWVICCLFQLISETVGLICAIGTKTSVTGINCTSAVLLVLLSFDGFLVSEIPAYFAWITKFSYISFAYVALYKNELSGLPVKESRTGIVTVSTGAHSQRLLVPSTNRFTVAENVMVLAAILFAVRVFAYALLKLFVKKKRV